MQQTLAIDLETFSTVDIKTAGMYKYVESPDFEILLLAYSINGAEPVVVDMAGGEKIPAEFTDVLQNMFVLKTAYNAQFERCCLKKYFDKGLGPMQWECTMAKASMLGLPLGLGPTAAVLKLDQQKMTEGKALIKYFCVPCKPTKTNGQRTRNLPEHDPEKWQKFIEYCRGDVKTELAIREKIKWFKVPDTEKRMWQLDQKINEGGMLVEPRLVKRAINMDRDFAERLAKEAAKLTGLDNPNSVTQLKNWLTAETGHEVESLNKNDVPGLLKKTECETVKRVLELRQQMSKTSIKKYLAMHRAACSDNRVRGLLQYYGANRTGRFAGRLVQVQNLAKNTLLDLDLARELVLEGDADTLEMAFGNIPDTLSQLIRTAFVAPPGHRFTISDFSAIEARVIAWLAGEKWRLDVFNTHGKIYEASGAAMFKVPIESVTKGSTLRDKAKIAELALGFQGGVNALLAMGAEKMGLKESELPELVSRWRAANLKICAYWSQVGEAAIECVDTGTPQTLSHGMKMFTEKGVFFIQLPSGRRLSYLRPLLRPGKFGPELCYEGTDQNTKKWSLIKTYGGKLVENIVQATARDILVDAMLRLDAAGYKIGMHVHDEIVLEVKDGEGSIEEVNKIMSTPIPWAKGLPLAADSYESKYYKKD
jgi:DNA polymerase